MRKIYQSVWWDSFTSSAQCQQNLHTSLYSGKILCKTVTCRMQYLIGCVLSSVRCQHTLQVSVIRSTNYLYYVREISTGLLISPQPNQGGNKLQRQKILIFIYPIYNHNQRNISTIYIYIKQGARGGVVVKALRYKPAGRVFDSRCCHWNFWVT